MFNYFTSSYLIGADNDIVSVAWYKSGTKTAVFVFFVRYKIRQRTYRKGKQKVRTKQGLIKKNVKPRADRVIVRMLLLLAGDCLRPLTPRPTTRPTPHHYHSHSASPVSGLGA